LVFFFVKNQGNSIIKQVSQQQVLIKETTVGGTAMSFVEEPKPDVTGKQSAHTDTPDMDTYTDDNGNKNDLIVSPKRINTSTSQVTQIKTLYPVDAKLLQYYYINEKIKGYAQVIRKINESLKKQESPIVDPQAIILISGAIFNINDNFYRRSELLQNCQKFNPSQKIDVPLLLIPISFDSLENISRNSPVGPYGITSDKLVPLPNKKKVLECMILLEMLLHSVNEVINQKFDIAIKQFNTQHKLNESRNSLIEKLQTFEFTEFTIIEQFIFQDIPNIDVKKQESILKYYLTSQFEFLELKCATFQNIIDQLKSDVHKSIVSITKQKQQSSTFTPLYSMYIFLLRIADLYIEIRKSGKTVYFQNINYFQPYAKQNKNLAEVLKRNSVLFTQAKQNSMILTLLSKYARRTEIKNLSLDFNIFVSEFRKVSLNMLTLLDKMINSLKDLHNEWIMILSEGKDNDFNKEYLREKLRRRVATDRLKRVTLILEDQKKMKAQLENQLAGSITPKDLQHQKHVQKIDFTGNNGTIDENKEVQASSSSSIIRTQRNLSQNLIKTRRASIHGLPVSPSQSSSRLSSLTSSSNSPFYKPNSAGSNESLSVSSSGSRSNSLTRTDLATRIIRKTSVEDIQANSTKNQNDIGTNSQSNTFIEPPKIGQLTYTSLQRKSSNGSLNSTVSPLPRSPSLSRQASTVDSPSSSSSRSNSVTSSPIARKTQTLQRRSSVNLSHSSSYTQLRAQIQNRSASGSPSNASSGASSATLKRRQSIIGLQSINADKEKEKEEYAKAAALASKKSLPTSGLTAQQRMQQHILKSTQNGSVYSKPLERREMTTKSMIAQKKQEESRQDIYLAFDNTIDEIIGVDTPKVEITPASPLAKKKLVFDTLDECIEEKKLHNHDVDVDEKNDKITDFPSPLNSLRNTSLEAQNALQLQRMNRSRSNSNQTIGNGNGNGNGKVSNEATPRSVKVRNSVSPTKRLTESPTLSPSPGPIPIPVTVSSQSSSPTKIRSRSNSATQKFNTNGSGNELSRQSTISRSRTRSRSSSVIVGNTIVVAPGDLSTCEEGIKKVRFTGVAEYNEDEDALTPLRAQKQIRQKWAAYKPLFRKLNSQEGLVFKQNFGEDTDELLQAPHSLIHIQFNQNDSQFPGQSRSQSQPKLTLRKPAIPTSSTSNESPNHALNATRRLSRFFKRK
jgi:hypothetical protein